MSDSLRASVIKGSVWMFASCWGIRGIGFISVSILARLLAPEDFGIVAMATIVMGMFNMLFAFGLDLALIKNLNSGRDQYDTAWTIRLIQGIAVAILLLVSIPLIVQYFKEQRLVSVIPCLSLVSVIKGFTNIGIVNFRKELTFNKEFNFMVTNKVISFFITITLGFVYRNYWALIIGMIAGELISVLQSYRMDPYRPRLSLKSFNEIWGFSLWMLLNNFINYFNFKGSELIVGGFSTKRDLGMFSISSEVAMMSTSELITPISRALYPGYARICHDPERIREVFVQVFSLIAIVVFATGFGISSIAEEAVKIFLGSQWGDATPILKILAYFYMIRISYSTIGNLFVVLGHLKLLTVIAMFETLFTLVLSYCLILKLGINGAAIGMVVSGCVFYFVNISALVSTTLISFVDIMRASIRPVMAGLTMVLSLSVFSGILFNNVIISLLVKISFGAMVYISIILTTWVLMKKPAGAESMIINIVNDKVIKRITMLLKK